MASNSPVLKIDLSSDRYDEMYIGFPVIKFTAY